MNSPVRFLRWTAAYGVSVADYFDELPVPRSVVLALWLNALENDPDVSASAATRAVEGVDEPHKLLGAPLQKFTSDAEVPVLLRNFLDPWRKQGERSAALLPVPGDASGIPRELTTPATDAGECVLLRIGSQHLALIPDIETFGSIYEQGFLVSWAVHEVEPWENRFLGTIGTLQDAERSLRQALRTTTEAIDTLDVARWRHDAAHAITSLGSAAPEPAQFPPGLAPRQVQVLTLATRLRAIVDLATDDDGGAVNLWQADQRSTALREVDYAARHAIAAATLPQPAK